MGNYRFHGLETFRNTLRRFSFNYFKYFKKEFLLKSLDLPGSVEICHWCLPCAMYQFAAKTTATTGVSAHITMREVLTSDSPPIE